MKLFGLTISRTKASQPMPVSSNRGWYRITESFTGAWQKNIAIDKASVLVQNKVFACQTLIASDFSKNCVDLVEETEDGIWVKTKNSAYSPVLNKPNRFQNRIQFWESWILSKLSTGNTYVLKQRDIRGVVKALYVLDPCRVTPMVTDDGTVYYQLKADNMAGLKDFEPLVPASEIIHDRFNCMFHPLIGLSPIVACGAAAMQALAIQNSSTYFFNNRAMPSGFLTAPGAISNDTASRLKDGWEANYAGENAGKVAILGDGLKFESMVMKAVDAELVDQLKMTSEDICCAYHVPGYKVGVGAIPSGASVESLNLEYLNQALHRLFEDAELCLDEGLSLPPKLGVQFDTDNLLRMDTLSLMEVLEKGEGFMKLDEQRKRINLPPLPIGGDTVYKQEQNYSVEALAKRDAMADPWAHGQTAPAPTPIPQPEPPKLPPPEKSIAVLRTKTQFAGVYVPEEEAA